MREDKRQKTKDKRKKTKVGMGEKFIQCEISPPESGGVPDRSEGGVVCQGKSKVQSPKSKVQSPKSKVESLKSKV